MRRTTWQIARFALTVAGLAVWTAATMASAAAVAAAPACEFNSPAGTLPTACSAPGQAVWFVDGAGNRVRELFVPPAGTGVALAAFGSGHPGRGAAVDVALETAADGSVHYRAGSRSITGSAAPASTDPCVDSAYRLERSRVTGDALKWYATLKWSYRDGSAPSYLNETDVIAALQTAGRHITGDYNDCGRPDGMHGVAAYLGRTSRATSISPDGRACGSGDGYSVTSFGDAADALAETCYWYISHSGADEIVEADIRLDKSITRWYLPGVTGCSGEQYSVLAVATHEFGHAFGLDHVSESSHPHLTMSPYSDGPCQNSEATLGLGDVNGLNALYP